MSWIVHSLLHAVPISAFILGLFYYWFAIADRYAVFLYEHLGATPFDHVTSSRYWMAGLVASGMVMIAYAGVNWLLGRAAALRRQEYRPPAWWRVWALCAAPLSIGIPAITMTVNQPTLSPSNAIPCVIATWIGLALALMPGDWAAHKPAELAWLALDGLALMPCLTMLRAVELPGRGLAISTTLAYVLAFGSVFIGAIGLGVTTALRAWRRAPQPGAMAVLAAGLGVSYVLMPVAHHVFATPPGYTYISTASNFFAFTPGVQLVALCAAALLAIGVTYLRQRWQGARCALCPSQS